MSVKIQVILDEEEAARFKAQAGKESKSLSSWLRDAGKTVLQMSAKKKPLNTAAELKKFFQESNRREKGEEPDWEDQKKLILESYQSGNHP